MRQRVALARALAQQADVLLMDEPFAALDAITRDVLHEELTSLWLETGVAVLFVTHNVREAVRLAQRVILLSSRPGRIVREWRVDLPQPRRIEDAAVAELAKEITAELHREISRHAVAAYSSSVGASSISVPSPIVPAPTGPPAAAADEPFAGKRLGIHNSGVHNTGGASSDV
jgi:NitT/TauT family transport system ATP-binding protein